MSATNFTSHLICIGWLLPRDWIGREEFLGVIYYVSSRSKMCTTFVNCHMKMCIFVNNNSINIDNMICVLYIHTYIYFGNIIIL